MEPRKLNNDSSRWKLEVFTGSDYAGDKETRISHPLFIGCGNFLEF
jgi:hypothetical protein